MTHPTAQWVTVPREPTGEMWSRLARDLVFWQRQHPHTGKSLYEGLRMIGREIPDWLLKEIPDTDHVPPKGTVAVCIYKAHLAAAPAPPAQGEGDDGYADSLRQQAKWIREALDPQTPETQRIDLGDVDVDELEAAAAHIVTLRAKADAMAEALERTKAFLVGLFDPNTTESELGPDEIEAEIDAALAAYRGA